VIAALFVENGGCYFGLPGVDPWDEERDARLYAGPWPVVAHPPCQRWGNYWFGSPSGKVRKLLGDDGGCFASALASVRRWGGVLEHPANSRAWPHFGLNTPPVDGGWVAADFFGGWTCCVDQGAYGHRARKATWLYACEVQVPSLVWGRSKPARAAGGDRKLARHRDSVEWMGKRDRLATPIHFRDLLLSIAASSRVAEVA
jgi:hypothetical protein